MARIATLHIYNVRNHRERTIDLLPRTTIITGKNGTGKTSLLESLYINLQGSSFRGGDKEIVNQNASWYRIDCIMDNGTTRSVRFDASKQTGKKHFIIDEKTNYRLPIGSKLPVVLFEPEDLRLLSGSPSRRRQFLDRIISQVDPQYHRSVIRYERALRQRNALLKKDTLHNDDLFVWNVALSEYGAYILQERVAFIERLNQQLADQYSDIAKTSDVVTVHYSHTLIDSIQQKLLHELSANLQKDSLLGYTTTGPHRDDLLFIYNNTPAHQIASRGENRTIVLALKLIESRLIESITGIKPLILLDDVFSELDEDRQNNITNSVYQTVITSTNISSAYTKQVINLTE